MGIQYEFDVKAKAVMLNLGPYQTLKQRTRFPLWPIFGKPKGCRKSRPLFNYPDLGFHVGQAWDTGQFQKRKKRL